MRATGIVTLLLLPLMLSSGPSRAAETVSVAAAGVTFRVPAGWTASTDKGVLVVGPAEGHESLSFRSWSFADAGLDVENCLDVVLAEVERVVDEFDIDDERTGRGRFAGIPCMQTGGTAVRDERELDVTVYALFSRRPLVVTHLLDPEFDLDDHVQGIAAFLAGVAATPPLTAPSGVRHHECIEGGVGVFVPAGWRFDVVDGALAVGPAGGALEYRLWAPEYDLGSPLEDESDLEGALGRYVGDIELEDLPEETAIADMYAIQLRGSAVFGDRDVAIVATVFDDSGPGVYQRPAILLRMAPSDLDLEPFAAQVATFEGSLYRILHR